MRDRDNQEGFTILEAAVSLAIFGTLMASVFSLILDTSSFIQDNDVDVSVQMEGNRAYQRFADIVRKSGRVTIGGVAYPRVTNGGADLELRILRDADGNGYAYDDATGALEWDPLVYTIAANGSGELGVYAGGNLVYPIARHIQALRFSTITEDATLHLKEVRIAFEARRPTKKGFDLIHSVNAGVCMRN